MAQLDTAAGDERTFKTTARGQTPRVTVLAHLLFHSLIAQPSVLSQACSQKIVSFIWPKMMVLIKPLAFFPRLLHCLSQYFVVSPQISD